MTRRFAVLGLLLLALTGSAGARQDRPLQADGIVRLLLDLEAAIGTGRIESLRAIATPALSQQALQRFESAARGGGARAIVRERTRRAAGSLYEVIVDVLVSRDNMGRVSTWQIAAEPGPAPGQFLIADFRELAGVDGLIKLRLDTARQFNVKDLVINAPDLTFRMASGTAFVAESPNGITALVLRGRADVNFAPADPAEQGQVRIFSGKPALSAQVDTAFLRINPAEFVLRVSDQSLTPAARVDPVEAQRATQIFDDMGARTFNIDLRSLTNERWSLEPTYGSVVLEFRTNRFGWLTYARSPSEAEDISLFERERQRNISLYTSAEQRTRRPRSYSDDDGQLFDIEHQRLDLSFDPSRLWVSGRASVQIRITAASVSSITIKLAQPLAVASVSSGTLGDLLFLRIIGQSSILVGLPDVIERGSVLVLDVVYGGRLESQALDREAIQVQGSRQETEPPLIVTPEARFLYSNRVPWYPQSATTDYSTAEMRLSVPSEYQIVASGTLTRAAVVPNNDPGRSGSKSLRVVEYLADRPVRYLACVISRFIPIGRSRVEVPGVSPPTVQRPGAAVSTADGLNLDVVSTTRMTGRNRQTPQRVASILRSFARITGEVPYPDFTLAALDDNLPGGHSPAYFAVFHQPLPTTPYSWAGDPVAFDDTYPHLFLAHEIAHQWWGQAIGWKNYHEQWLSEGLAQYFAAVYAAEDRGPEMLDTLILGMRKSAEPYLTQGPISLGYRLGHIRTDGRVFRAIVYNKSAVVLHMLRRMIGDDAFFKGIKRFYTDFRFRKAGTDDLRAAFEAETPMKLERFFERWVRGFARPSLIITWRHTEPDGAVIRVEQAGEVFDLPLTIAIQFADGRTETRVLKLTEKVYEEKIPGASTIRRVTAKDELSLYEIAR